MPAPTRLRFPKSARLSSAAEFARLKREGQSFHGKLIVLSVLKADPESEPRLGLESEARIGLITSRRVGGAVVRNRVRRRLREIVRVLRPRLVRGLQIVIIARSSAAKADFSMLRADLLHLAERSAILGASTCS